MKYLPLLAAGWLLSACAYSSSLDVASDTIQVTTEAAPVCGQAGAQKVAAQRAAIETLKRGYDRYIILDGAYQNNVGVIGTTPVVANTYGTGVVNAYGNSATYNGQSTTYVTGGQPIIGGHHVQSFMVKMFKESDPASGNAVNAKQVLGPDWQKAVKKGTVGTC
jgi:hypothetical protein